MDEIFDRNVIDYDKYFDLSQTKPAPNIYFFEKSVHIFVSLDICNSTKMKSTYSNWKTIIEKFYERKSISYLNKWKYIGDEVVFEGEYKGFNELLDLINITYCTIKAMEDELKKAIIKVESNATEFPHIKGTMWMTKMAISEKDNDGTLLIKTLDEFIGINVDEGFRMATQSMPSWLLIDPKIIFILLYFYSIRTVRDINENASDDFSSAFVNQFSADPVEMGRKIFEHFDKKETKAPFELTKKIVDILSKIHFKSYVSLKGIWNNQPYPIFMYSNSSDMPYYYFENTNSLYSLINSYNKNNNVYYLSELYSIFKQVNANKNLDGIIEAILDENAEYKTNYIRETVSNFYYTVACVYKNKVLVAKRKPERRHLGNVWEFFVCKHSNINANDDIKSNFQKSFDQKIELFTDTSHEQNIIPLHLCTIYRTQKKHNSILCCGEMRSDLSEQELVENINSYLSSNKNITKYEKVALLSDDDASQFQPLTADVIEYDAEIANTSKSHPFIDSQKYSSMYLKESVHMALSFYAKYKSMTDDREFSWENLFDSNRE